MSLLIAVKNVTTEVRSPRRICGLLGTINLINGKHLILATHRIFVGIINGQVIWRLAGYDIIPYIPSPSNLNELQVKFLYHLYLIKIIIFCYREVKMKPIFQCCILFWIHHFFIFLTHMI